MARKTKKEQQLTRYEKLNAYTRCPAFSPDGKSVVYEYAATLGNIWMVSF